MEKKKTKHILNMDLVWNITKLAHGKAITKSMAIKK